MTATETPAVLDTFTRELVRHGLIVPVDADGAFGRSGEFERVLEGVDRVIRNRVAPDNPEIFAYPPVIARRVLERVGYMQGFPHLCGGVYEFVGDDAAAQELWARLAADEDYGALLRQTELTLNPAACYPVYPALTGVLPLAGRSITMLNWVYRREPSPSAVRMQSFRVREFVRLSEGEEVADWRSLWIERTLGFVGELGLQAKTCAASDPFFGRTGKLLAAGQREANVKIEIVAPIVSPNETSAICSFNLHHNRFAEVFDIRVCNGALAESACVGFGLDRVTMALFARHGFVADAWPEPVRVLLGL